MIKNDIFLKTLRGESTPRPPVWMMRQAGRYLPEFRLLREKYDFFTRCRTPELAAEITVQPIRTISPDAAILFSDILVVPQAMGVEVQMKEGVGPWLPEPIRSERDVNRVVVSDVKDTLGYVFEAVKLTKQMLNNGVPLIGFAGAPWTILCYMIQGRGSKSFDLAKGFCFSQPKVAHLLLQKITDITVAYLREKVASGCDAIQIFDSWGGLLSPEDYEAFSWTYTEQIVNAIAPIAPVIVFAKGCWYTLKKISAGAVSAIGVDWTCSPYEARRLVGDSKVLQGNLDPAKLLAPIPEITRATHEMIRGFGTQNYIANLGHGILPNIPVEHAKAFVNAVKSFGV